MLFHLDWIEHYNLSLMLGFVKRDQNNQLQLIWNNHQELSEPLKACDAHIRDREERQTISLFRSLLKFSRGIADYQQGNLELDFS